MRRVWRFHVGRFEVRVEIDTDGLPRPEFYRWGKLDGEGWSVGFAPKTADTIFSIDVKPTGC